jgi:Ca2+-binding EF-hand superfamily protein
MIDSDGSKTIDKAETLKFWSKNFPKLNSNELFDQVDKNNDGSIQLNEWIEFWTLVLHSGHNEEEVEAEVRRKISYLFILKFFFSWII